jgi:hypothetical protein
MNRCFSRCARALLVFPALLLASVAPAALAQAKPLITTQVDESKLVSLKGAVSPKLKDAQDLGEADASQAAGRLLLVLQRSPEQETAVQSFLQQVHQPGSPNFHKWLTPASFAQQFGAADSDIEQLTGWLQAHGLTVAKVAAGKNAIEFSGTVGQVQTTFHTSIHTYKVDGATHYANATAPQIPAAFNAIVAGVSQLNDFKPVSQARRPTIRRPTRDNPVPTGPTRPDTIPQRLPSTSSRPRTSRNSTISLPPTPPD